MGFLKEKKRIQLTAAVIAILFIAAGCSAFGPARPSGTAQPSATPEASAPADSEKSSVLNYVYTTKRSFAVVFSGMSDKNTMEAILSQLDKYNMKALFFLPGIRVAEEPDIAKEILERGHSIGNDGLEGTDLTKLGYGEICNRLQKTSQVIKDETGTAPKFLWNLGGKYNDDVLAAAKASGLQFVTYNINLQKWEEKTSADVQNYLENKITRGGIIALPTNDLNTALNTLDLIAKVGDEMGYSVQPLEYLIANAYERKPLKEIPGWDAAKLNPNYQNTEYDIVYNGLRDRKVVSISFDDWGCDLAVTRLLDVLDKYNVKATFFLRGNGPEMNPNLAKAIAEGGHDVANHTYTHPVLTTQTPEQVQEQIVKCHQVLTEAIQKEPKLLFRPPTGEINEVTARAIAATGYKDISLYDVSPLDWSKISEDKIVDYIKKNVTNGSVIVMHLMIELDTYKALPKVIEFLQQQGYTIMPLSELVSSGNAEILHQLPEWEKAQPSATVNPNATPTPSFSIEE